MKKRLLSAFVAFCIVLSLLSGTVWAAATAEMDTAALSGQNELAATSGTCGDNVYWNFNETTRTLTISGMGQMDDYANCRVTDTNHGYGGTFEIYSDRIPWYRDRQEIREIVIEPGVTSIGSGAFYESSATSVSLSNSIISIGAVAFCHNKNLTAIAIPESVKKIDVSAFGDCTSLASISFSNGINSIGVQAFGRCTALTEVEIPGSVDRISAGAFERCTALTDVSFLDGVACIGYWAFTGCTDLTSLRIPQSLVSIERSAFDYCKKLTDIYYRGSVETWNSIEKDSYGSDSGSTFEIFRNAAIHYNSTGPDDVNRQTISGILRSGEGWNIRWECSYSLDANGAPRNGRVEITASESNTKEELYLYNDASADGFPWELAPYNIPKTAVTSLSIRGSISKKLRITANSFTGYNNLQTVALNGVSGIDANAFYGCSKLEQIALASPDETLAHISSGAFKNCTSLSSVNFPGALTSIGAEAFRNTALEDITLWRNLEKIGENAFTDCSSLKISCYENSVAHRYAVENSIPFQLIPEPVDTSIKAMPIQFHLGTAGQVNMNLDWGWDLFRSSSTYDGRLAVAGLALSSEAEYSEAGVKSLLGDFGFKTTDSKNYGQSWKEINYPGVAFGYQNVNGEHYFIIVIRGTNINEPEDIVTDLNGFIMSSRNLHAQLNTFIQIACNLGLSDIQEKCKFFITGHSLGGATANVLATTLSDEYGANNVFCYTFASPKPVDFLTGNASRYNNIFNTVNLEDEVPYLPGMVLFARYGNDIFFHRGTTPKFYDFFKQLTGRDFDKGIITGTFTNNAHDTAVYMSFVLTNKVGGSVRIIRCACPVDIEIYDSNELLVGRVVNNVVSNTETEKVFIHVEGDEKYLYLLVDDEYTIKLVGTDDGTMTYSVHELDMGSGKTTNEIVYENVTLTAGKQMSSKPSVSDISQVPLYVLDSDGQPEKEVLPDGNGTEVPIEPPASCEHEYTTAVTAPTCTERGYTTHTCSKCSHSYTDSYTAALGHSYGAWTVTSSATSTTNGQQERVCSRCGDKQTGIIPATGGGSNTPSHSSSNDSNPTYRIDVPTSFTGGSLSITPTSASAGLRVTITVKPDSGYQLAKLTVTDSKNTELTLIDKGNGKYTFTMPDGKVIVAASFEPIQPTTPNTETTTWSNPFTDVATSAWYYDAVKFVNEAGLMNGTSSSIFAPNASLSRAMLAQILYNKEGRPAVTGSVFTDVESGAWYADAVTWAAERGIVSGYGNGLFGPGDNITREQLAVMLWRYAGEPAATNKELHFTDADTASGYAVDALRWATENGIINGKGNGILDPGGFATRAQAAQMLMNYLQK